MKIAVTDMNNHEPWYPTAYVLPRMLSLVRVSLYFIFIDKVSSNIDYILFLKLSVMGCMLIEHTFWKYRQPCLHLILAFEMFIGHL